MTDPTYSTRSGDTWDGVALRALGAERYMDLMIAANPERNYVAIFGEGVVLVVPEIPAPERPASLPPWRVA